MHTEPQPIASPELLLGDALSAAELDELVDDAPPSDAPHIESVAFPGRPSDDRASNAVDLATSADAPPPSDPRLPDAPEHELAAARSSDAFIPEALASTELLDDAALESLPDAEELA